MRLFVAFELPENAREEMRRALDPLRPLLPPARWVQPDQWHLTLRFLGEIDAREVPGLEVALRECFASSAPIALRPSGAGSFPGDRSPRVLWIGVEGGSELSSCQQKVTGAVERELDLDPEGKPFHAHLTVARIKAAWPRRGLELWQSRLGDFSADSFVAAEGALIESRLQPSGVRYRRVAAYPMGRS